MDEMLVRASVGCRLDLQRWESRRTLNGPVPHSKLTFRMYAPGIVRGIDAAHGPARDDPLASLEAVLVSILKGASRYSRN